MHFLWDQLKNQVTCFEYAGQLLPREDPDAAKCLERALLEDGLDIRLGMMCTIGSNVPAFLLLCIPSEWQNLSVGGLASDPHPNPFNSYKNMHGVSSLQDISD